MSGASGKQNFPAQATAGRPGGVQSLSTSGDANHKSPQTPGRSTGGGQSMPQCPQPTLKVPTAAAVTKELPPTGVLVDFDEDVQFVRAPPSMVAEMETANAAHLDKQRLSEQPAAERSDGHARGASVHDAPVCSYRTRRVFGGSVASSSSSSPSPSMSTAQNDLALSDTSSESSEFCGK
jgi:hypothetical protein